MEGRQWSDGLHQAVEAKEGVPIKPETQTFATASLQNIFKMYKKLSGMTGTAMTEANEFWKIYKLDVVAIPTNRDMKRIEHPDLIYLTEKDKFKALADEVERAHKWDVLTLKDGSELWGQDPVRERPDEVSIILKETKVPEKVPNSKITAIERCRASRAGRNGQHRKERTSVGESARTPRHRTFSVLNAKQHGREADIVAQAGPIGRRHDRHQHGRSWYRHHPGREPRDDGLGPAATQLPDTAWKSPTMNGTHWSKRSTNAKKMSIEGETVRELGGLYVIGTERHESRRIDLQLRGRCGRQGDPGGSRFFSVARRRPDAHLCRRLRQKHDGTIGDERRRSDRILARHAPHRRGAERKSKNATLKFGRACWTTTK